MLLSSLDFFIFTISSHNDFLTLTKSLSEDESKSGVSALPKCYWVNEVRCPSHTLTEFNCTQSVDAVKSEGMKGWAISMIVTSVIRSLCMCFYAVGGSNLVFQG